MLLNCLVPAGGTCHKWSKLNKLYSAQIGKNRSSLDPASRRNPDGSGCLSCPPAPGQPELFLTSLVGDLVKTGLIRAKRNFAALHAFVFVGGK